MIYQFEHEEIKQCEYCKLCDLDYDWCNMQSCLIDKYESPKVNNCPLVAISKTETTSCEWCEKIGKYAGFAYATFFEQTAPDEQYEISVECNYCPNCGKALKGGEDA